MQFDALTLTVFIAATFAGAFVIGLSGFAFGLVAAPFWLLVLSPLQVATLIVAFAMTAQGYSAWQLRRQIEWKLLWPFLLGSAVGIPFGIWILERASPQPVRKGFGVFLIVYSLYSLFRPHVAVKADGVAVHTGVGIVNGLMAGLTGLSGVIIAIWCGLKGWPRDRQRALFQPAAAIVFIMTLAWLGKRGALTQEIGWLVLIGMPALLAGIVLGVKAYGVLDEAKFRRIVLIVLLMSGIGLIL